MRLVHYVVKGLLAAVIFGTAVSAVQAADVRPGVGSFRFTGWPVAPLTVWYAAPDKLGPETPVVFVMHGLKRDGADYRNGWIDLVRQHGFLVLVPEFPNDKFPGARSYNLGNVKTIVGTPNPPETWTFGAIDPIFEHVAKDLGLSAKGFALFGHSAGAQFVHRFTLFQTKTKMLRAVAANAGWYTMPLAEEPFPYGLQYSGIDEAGLKRFLGRRLTVLLGDDDTDPNSRSLRRTPAALRQGPHRFARGHGFFRAGKQVAQDKGYDFGWNLAVAPGVGHSNAGMARYAVSHLLYGGAVQPGPVCHFSGVVIRADFPGGRLNGCQQTGSRSYRLTISPEAAPINPSPWYAFTVSGERQGDIVLTLRYDHGRHRYHPKTGYEPMNLDPLPVDAVAVAADRSVAHMRVPVTKRPLYIAAQDLIRAKDYDRWLDRHIDSGAATRRWSIGSSRDGRSIDAISAGRTDGRQVVIIGRQHPPEIPGVIALLAFTDRMLADDPLAKRFREEFSLLIVPNLNPDGVARGHWRNNTGGIDMNRDWGRFTQPETRAARDAILEVAGPQRDRLALFFDFHATTRDIFYTQHDPVGAKGTGFTARWLDAIDKRLPDYTPLREGQHNAAIPATKTWVYEVFRIPAITYEVGDDTDENLARQVARTAAEEAMKLLLDGDGKDEER